MNMLYEFKRHTVNLRGHAIHQTHQELESISETGSSITEMLSSGSLLKIRAYGRRL